MKKGFCIAFALLFLCGFSFGIQQARAYDFEEAIRDVGPQGQGLEHAIELIDYLKMVITLGKADDETADFFRYVVNSAGNFDFKKLYKNEYFKPWPNGFRGVTFRAVFLQGGDYELRMIPHDATLMDRAELDELGAFIAEFGLRKNDESPVKGDSSYSMILESDGVSGMLSHENIVRLADNLMRVIDPDNLAELRIKNKVPFGQPFDVVDEFRQSFPLFTHFNGISRVSSQAIIQSYNGVRFTDFTLHIGFNPDELRKQFPHMAKYLKNLKNVVRIDDTLKNMKGHDLLQVIFDTQEEFFTLRVCTKGGKVVPTTRTVNGITPFFDEAYSLTNLTDYDWESVVKAYFNAKGITFTTDDIMVSGKYSYTDSDMLFDLKMKNKPDFNISGAAYGIIPLWLINMFIPGTVDSITSDFIEGMYKANLGESTLFHLDWHKTAPKFWWLHWEAKSEFIDNGLIRMAARMMWKNYRMNEKTQEDVFKFLNMGADLMLEDLKNMKNQ